MKPTQIHPVLATTMGYDIDAMNDDQKVTLVRRRIVYEELVMSKKQFEQMNNCEDDDFYLNELEMKDIEFPDFVEEETRYTAFPGDVTSFTDDAIGFLFEDYEWTDAYEPVRLAS